MKSRPARLAFLGALSVGVACSLQACSLNLSDPATATATATAEPTSPTVAACTDNEIRADVTWQPQAVEGATRMGLVALTNKSARPCTLHGRAAVTLTNAADQDVAVPTENVEQPGPATAFTLPAGITAFEGIKWTVCDKGRPTCGAGNGLRVRLPGQGRPLDAELFSFPDPEKSDITMAELQVGTIQPSHEGVVAW